MLRTFIQVTALNLTLIASMFLIMGSLTLSVKDIGDISSTYFGHNKALVKNLSRQKASTAIGFILLLGGFLFQMINLLWPMRYCDFDVDKTGIILAICFSVIILLVSFYARNTISTKMQTEVTNILAR